MKKSYNEIVHYDELDAYDGVELGELYNKWAEEHTFLDVDSWKGNYALMCAFLLLPGHYTEQ